MATAIRLHRERDTLMSLDLTLAQRVAAILDRPDPGFWGNDLCRCQCDACVAIRAKGLACAVCGFIGEPIVQACDYDREEDKCAVGDKCCSHGDALCPTCACRSDETKSRMEDSPGYILTAVREVRRLLRSPGERTPVSRRPSGRARTVEQRVSEILDRPTPFTVWFEQRNFCECADCSALRAQTLNCNVCGYVGAPTLDRCMHDTKEDMTARLCPICHDGFCWSPDNEDAVHAWRMIRDIRAIIASGDSGLLRV